MENLSQHLFETALAMNRAFAKTVHVRAAVYLLLNDRGCVLGVFDSVEKAEAVRTALHDTACTIESRMVA